jgi:hypothetical protein
VSGVCIVDSSYCDDGKMRHWFINNLLFK